MATFLNRNEEIRAIAAQFIEADKEIKSIEKQISDLNNQKCEQITRKETAEKKLKECVGSNIQEKCIKVDSEIVQITFDPARVRVLPLE